METEELKYLMEQINYVGKEIVKLIPEHVKSENITTPIYEHYKTVYVFEVDNKPVYLIGTFKENTPELIKAILQMGFKVAVDKTKEKFPS